MACVERGTESLSRPCLFGDSRARNRKGSRQTQYKRGSRRQSTARKCTLSGYGARMHAPVVPGAAASQRHHLQQSRNVVYTASVSSRPQKWAVVWAEHFRTPSTWPSCLFHRENLRIDSKSREPPGQKKTILGRSRLPKLLCRLAILGYVHTATGKKTLKIRLPY